MAVSGVALAAMAAGGIFVYSAVTNKSTLKVLHSVVTGTAPNTVPSNASLLNSDTSAGASAPAPAPATGGGGAPISSSNSANQAMGKLLAAQRGWTGSQWTDLQSLWTRESGWSNTADTRKSGAGGDNMSSTVFAYGIAQARPAEKYPKPGWPPDKGGSADPQTQIIWGLDYIQSVYGTPSAAWAHETANSWY